MRQILQQILDRATSEDEQWRPSLSVLRDAWPGLVGDRIAAVTRLAAVNWQQASFTIEVASENWRDELQRHDYRLLERIRQVLPWEIRRLDFQVGMPGTSHRFQDDDTDDSPPETAQDRAEESAATTGSDREPLRPEDSSDGDVTRTLESLDDSTADSARRILEHIRDQVDS